MCYGLGKMYSKWPLVLKRSQKTPGIATSNSQNVLKRPLRAYIGKTQQHLITCRWTVSCFIHTTSYVQEIEHALEKTLQDLNSLSGKGAAPSKADAATAAVAEATLLSSSSDSSSDLDGDLSPLASYDSMRETKVRVHQSYGGWGAGGVGRGVDSWVAICDCRVAAVNSKSTCLMLTAYQSCSAAVWRAP